MEMNVLRLRIGLMGIGMLLMSCAGLKYQEFSRLNPPLDLRVSVVDEKGIPLDAQWIGNTEREMVLRIDGTVNRLMPPASVRHIQFRDVFVDVSNGKTINFYAYHPDSVSIPAYQMLFYPPDTVRRFQLIGMDSLMAEIHIPDSKIGFLPVHVYRRDLVRLAGLNEDDWFKLAAVFKHDQPLALTPHALQDTSWKWQFKRFLYVSVWIASPQAELYRNPSPSSAIDRLNRGTELYSVDTLQNFIQVVDLENGFRQGWIRKEDVSYSAVTPISPSEMEQWRKQTARQDWIRKHKIKGAMADAILAGKVVEGMTQAMVIASWGEPKQKIKRGSKYFYPVVWIYTLDQKTVTMNFDRDGILQTLHTEKK